MTTLLYMKQYIRKQKRERNKKRHWLAFHPFRPSTSCPPPLVADISPLPEPWQTVALPSLPVRPLIPSPRSSLRAFALSSARFRQMACECRAPRSESIRHSSFFLPLLTLNVYPRTLSNGETDGAQINLDNSDCV